MPAIQKSPPDIDMTRDTTPQSAISSEVRSAACLVERIMLTHQNAPTWTLSAAIGVLALASASAGQPITEIIGASEDAPAAPLTTPIKVNVDGSGNVHVTGNGSDNVFRITPARAVTETLNPPGDGAGDLFAEPTSVAAELAGNDLDGPLAVAVDSVSRGIVTELRRTIFALGGPIPLEGAGRTLHGAWSIPDRRPVCL